MYLSYKNVRKEIVELDLGTYNLTVAKIECPYCGIIHMGKRHIDSKRIWCDCDSLLTLTADL